MYKTIFILILMALCSVNALADDTSLPETSAEAIGQSLEKAYDSVMLELKDICAILVQHGYGTKRSGSIETELQQHLKKINQIAKSTTNHQGLVLTDGDVKELTFLDNTTFRLRCLKTSHLGMIDGRVETEGLRISVHNNYPDKGTQGIKESEMKTIISSGDITLNIDGKFVADIGAEENGGDLNLTAPLGVNSHAARKLADRINAIALSKKGLGRLHATARTQFSASSIKKEDYSGARIPHVGGIAQGRMKNGQMVINGCDIGPADFKDDDIDYALRDAINARYEKTGVAAMVEGGRLILVAPDGRDIILSVNEMLVEQLFGKGRAESFDSGFANLRVTGSVTVSADGTMAFAGANTSDSGFNGTQGGSNIKSSASLNDINLSNRKYGRMNLMIINAAIEQIKAYKKALSTLEK